MFFYHLLSFKNLFIYLIINIIMIFIIHYLYADIFIYFILKKLLNFTNIYAISFYEIIITKIYSSLTLTIINFILNIYIYFLLYLISGLYKYELFYIINLIKNLFYLYFIIIIIGLCIITPIILNPNVYYESNLIYQIYSYNNVISLIIKIIILWSILVILPKIYNNLIKNNAKIRHLSIIVSIIGILSPLTIDIVLQLKLIIAICLYLEIYIIKTLFKKNLIKNFKK